MRRRGGGGGGRLTSQGDLCREEWVESLDERSQSSDGSVRVSKPPKNGGVAAKWPGGRNRLTNPTGGRIYTQADRHGERRGLADRQTDRQTGRQAGRSGHRARPDQPD